MGISTGSQRALIIAALLLPLSAYADDYVWLNPTGGDAADPLNWFQDPVQELSRPSMRFEVGFETYTVDMSAPLVTADNALIRNYDTVTWDLQGNSLSFLDGSGGGSIAVGGEYNQDGILTIYDGHVDTTYVTVAGSEYSNYQDESSRTALNLREGASLTAEVLQLGGFNESSNTINVGNIADSVESQLTTDTAHIGWGSAGTVNVANGLWNTYELYVGYGEGSADVNVTNGELNFTRMFLGAGTEGVGNVTVDGSSGYANLENEFGGIAVGYLGDGNLTLQNAATASLQTLGIAYDSSEDAVGTVLVDSYSTLAAQEILVGGDGTGIMTVSGGATVTTSSMDVDGRQHAPDSSGHLTITGEETSAFIAQLDIAAEAQGDVVISDYAQLETGEIRLAENGTGSLSIEGNGCQFNDCYETFVQASVVYVGEGQGSGVISVTDGATFNSWNISLGSTEGEGTLSINSARVLTGDISVGEQGTASVSTYNGLIDTGNLMVGGSENSNATVSLTTLSELNARQGVVISEGGRMDVSDSSSVFSQGEIVVQHGGVLTISSSVVSADEGLIINEDGRLEVADDSIFSGPISVREGGVLSLDGFMHLEDDNLYILGQLEGTGDISGSVFNEGGIVGPGESIGSLTMGSYTELSLSQMVMEIAGFGAGTGFDYIHVDDTGTLAGTLVVELLDTFMPEVGDSFQLLTSLNLFNGQFSSLDLPDLAAGMEWLLEYNNGEYADGGNVVLSVQASVVPIPAAVWLFASALAALGLKRRAKLH